MLQALISLAEKAGRQIMAIYPEDPGVAYKSDHSPLTRADRASHATILAGLKAHFPETPVVSEEAALPEAKVRQGFTRYFLVDPLDGTKEFIKKNGEFTVNIALIEGQKPVLGIVHVPAQNLTYAAELGKGAFRYQAQSTPVRLQAAQWQPGMPIKASVSRSHPSPRLASFFSALGKVEEVALGSALKFCHIAEGAVHLYPRLGPTMEWDTAAAQLVAEESGAQVCTPQGQPFLYTKDDLLNGWFLVACHSDLMARALRAFQASE